MDGPFGCDSSYILLICTVDIELLLFLCITFLWCYVFNGNMFVIHVSSFLEIILTRAAPDFSLDQSRFTNKWC